MKNDVLIIKYLQIFESSYFVVGYAVFDNSWN